MKVQIQKSHPSEKIEDPSEKIEKIYDTHIWPILEQPPQRITTAQPSDRNVSKWLQQINLENLVSTWRLCLLKIVFFM